MAWERPLQSSASMAEAGMALRLRQRPRIRLPGRRLWSWGRLRQGRRIRIPARCLQSLGMPEVPVATTLVVGKPQLPWVRSTLLHRIPRLPRLREPTRALSNLPLGTLPYLLVGSRTQHVINKKETIPRDGVPIRLSTNYVALALAGILFALRVSPSLPNGPGP